MEYKVVLEPEDVLENIQHQLVDVDQFFDYASTDNINTYYRQTLKNIVTDLVVIPVERKNAGLEPMDESEHDIPKILMEVSCSLSTLFEKDQREVEKDLEKIIVDFPVKDVQFARLLRHQNRLN